MRLFSWELGSNLDDIDMWMILNNAKPKFIYFSFYVLNAKNVETCVTNIDACNMWIRKWKSNSNESRSWD